MDHARLIIVPSMLRTLMSINGVAMLRLLALFSLCLTVVSGHPNKRNPAYNASELPESQILNSPYPYEFPVFQYGTEEDNGQFPMPSCNGLTLEEATIDQLQEALSTGKLTTVTLTLCYLQRIYQTDQYTRYVEKSSWILDSKRC